MNKKNVDYILSSTDAVELLANLFQNGMALDLVDVTRARDNVDLPEDERHIYDMADAALDRVDLDKLYENAEDFELQDKYPEFFDYLQSLQRDRENDEPERVREDEAGEVEEEIEEELEEGAPEPLSTRDTVVKNIIEGEHTGKESDSRKYVEKDEYRAKLDAEREESIRRALEADEALNKERELAAREADAARLREQEFFDKRKAEEADFDEKTRREKEAERYTEKDIDRSKSFEDRKDEAKIDKDYSTNTDKQVDSSFRSNAVDNAGDAGKHGYQQSEQIGNMHGGTNDVGDVSNSIHNKTYGTETAAETAATAAAMEMARREAAAKAQAGYGNTEHDEAASRAETEKRNAEGYNSDKKETSKSQEESSRLDNSYSSKTESQIDGNSRTGSVNNAGDAGKRGYQQSEQIGNMHGGTNDVGDVSNSIHNKTYGTETAAETAATAAAMEMARREAAAKAQAGYGNTEHDEAASRAETEKRNAEGYNSDKKETSKSQEESSRLDNSYSSKTESQIDGNSRTGSVNDAGDAGKRGYQQSEQIGSTHYGDSNAGDVTHVVKSKEYETSKETADARKEVEEAVRRDTAAREQKEAEGDRRSRREQEERRERQERAERKIDSYGSDTTLRDEDTKREMDRRQHEAEANRYRDIEGDKRDQYSGSGKYEPEQRTEAAMRDEALREMDRRQQEADKYRNTKAGKNETDTKREQESGTGSRVNNDYNSNRESQIDSSSRTGSVNDAGDAGTRNNMQSERVENLHNGSTNAGDVTNVVGGKTYASETATAAAATAAADEMARREAAAKEQREADRGSKNGGNRYNEYEDRKSNTYNPDAATRDYDAGREMERRQREAEANRYNDYRNAETDKRDQYDSSGRYEPEQRTEAAMRREMDRRQQEADRYRNAETSRKEADSKRDSETGNRVDNSYNSNRDRQVDSSSRTGSVHDAGNAGTRNSMQSEQVGNLHNGSTNAGDVTNVIGGRAHASDAAAATSATVTATAAAAEIARREAAAKEQRGAEADLRNRNEYDTRNEIDKRQHEASGYQSHEQNHGADKPDSYSASGKYEPEQRIETAMREDARMEMDRRQREADARRDDKVTSPENRPNQERPAEHRIDNNYNTQPGRQIDGTFKTGTVSETGKNTSQPEKIDSVHGGSSTAKESLNAIKAKDYTGDNKSTATPVQPVGQSKDTPGSKQSGNNGAGNNTHGTQTSTVKSVYERDSYETAGQKAAENFGSKNPSQAFVEKSIAEKEKQAEKESSKIIGSENKGHIYTAKDGDKNNHVQINKTGTQVVDGHVSKDVSGPADNVIKTPGSSKLDVSKAVAGQVAAAAAIGAVAGTSKTAGSSPVTTPGQAVKLDKTQAGKANNAALWNNAINNTQGLASTGKKLIADSYAMAGQIDAVTAKMNAEASSAVELPSFGFSPISAAGIASSTAKNIAAGTMASSIAAAKIGSEILDASNMKRIKSVGVIGAIRGNEVGLKFGDSMKFFTIRSDGTINVNGTLMDVHRMNDTSMSNLVFVGWKDTFVTNGEIITSHNTRFKIGADGKSIESGSGLNLSMIHGKIDNTYFKDGDIAGKIRTPGMTVSYAPSVMNNTLTGADFIQDGDTFSVNGLSERFGDRNISNLLRRHQITGTIDRQGRIMMVMMSRHAANEMRNIQFSKESLDFLAQNYNKILAVNADTASKIAKLNKVLEDRHLSDIEKEYLFDLRAKLKSNGMTENVDKLKKQLKSGALTENQAKLAQEYISAFDNSRKTIVKNGILAYDRTLELEFQLSAAGLLADVEVLQKMLDNGQVPEEYVELVNEYIKTAGIKIKRGTVEDGFFAASMAMLVEANNLPSNPRALRKLLKSGNVTEEQRKIIENLLKINRRNRIMGFLARQARRVQRMGASAYHRSKSFMNKYMGSDYTFRGLMMMLGGAAKVRNAAQRAYRTVRFVRTLPMKFTKALDATRKAAISTAKVTMSAARAGAKAVRHGARFVGSTHRLIQRKGLKFTLKRRGKHAVRKFKMLGKGMKNLSIKSLKAMLQVIIRLLTMIGSALIGALLPILLIVLFALIIVFSVLSFISNEGDEVYYDAGDEDTEEAAQEMVDLLTLCHASFRSALSAGSAGGSASGIDEDGGPQMQKGDVSQVGGVNGKKGLYDVTSGTWANYECAWDHFNWAADCRTVYDYVNNQVASGAMTMTNNGGYLVLGFPGKPDAKIYVAAFGTYWGKVGDILKVKFDNPVKLGNETSDEIYVLKFDTKAWKDTGYPSEPEGIYGHKLGGHRDFIEFLSYPGYEASPHLPNGEGVTPVEATNMGNIIDGSCDLATIGGGLATSVSMDVFYRQEIDQDVYREILDPKKNIYYTFPEDQEQPDGISPTPTPKGYDKSTANGAVYGFYNNNQELISMVLAMYDFDINQATSVKKTILAKEDKSGINEEAADKAHELDVTNKIDDDTWKLITYFDKYGLDLTNYTIGGYDDLRYSTLVALFNASHIITWTPVIQYHQGPDGKPIYDKNGKAIDETNEDGLSYQEPVYETTYKQFKYKDGSIGLKAYTQQKTDANGDKVYKTITKPCPGHRKTSTAVITLHFDSLLDIKGWWEKNIYSVDDFDKENPNYSSDDPKDSNYKAKEAVLKNGVQRIKKPEFKMGISGTCSDDGSATSAFSPGTMTESQKQVCKQVYKFLVNDMKPKLTKNQAIGVLVNIMRECSFDYTAIENSDGSGGYGLIQWTGGRRTNLVNWCTSNGYKYNTIEGQCKFLEHEFASSEVWTNAGVDGFLQCSSARDAGLYILKYFERPAQEYQDQRESEMDQDIATVENMLS